MAYNKPNFPATLDPSNPINNGLLGCWLFNEGAGLRAFDISGKKNHGTLTGGPKWTAGKSGMAVNLDGTDDYVTMGDISDLNFDRTTPFSFSFWISVRTIASQIILSKQDSAAPTKGYFIAVSSTGQIRVSLRNTVTTNEIDTSTTAVMFPDSGWRHVVLTYSGSSTAAGLKIYVNTVERAQTVSSDTLSSSIANSMPFQLSGRNGANVVINASMALVRAYNRPLSLSEIQRLYAEPFAGIAVPNRLPVMNSLSAAITRVWAAVFG